MLKENRTISSLDRVLDVHDLALVRQALECATCALEAACFVGPDELDRVCGRARQAAAIVNYAIAGADKSALPASVLQVGGLFYAVDGEAVTLLSDLSDLVAGVFDRDGAAAARSLFLKCRPELSEPSAEHATKEIFDRDRRA